MSRLENYVENIKKYWKDNSELSETEIVRYIYLDLGKRFSFNLNYAFGNRDSRKRIYNESFRHDEMENVMNNNVGICVSMAYIMERILKEVGVDIHTIKSPYDDSKLAHVYNIIHGKDGKSYSIDLQEDLMNIQSHFQTEKFGLDLDLGNRYIVSLEEQKKMDIKLGFVNSEKPYANEYIYFLKSYLGYFTKLEDKVKFALENLEFYNESNMKYAEKKWKHEQLLSKLFSYKELRKIHQLDCYRGDDKEYKLYISVESR